MKHARVPGSLARAFRVVGPVSLSLIACGANACGGGSTASTSKGSSSSSGGGYGTSSGLGLTSSSGFTTSSSGSGDDATADSPGDDGDDGSSQDGGEDGMASSGGEDGGEDGMASSGGEDGGEGGASSSSSGSGSTSSGSGSGSSSGSASSSGSGSGSSSGSSGSSTSSSGGSGSSSSSSGGSSSSSSSGGSSSSSSGGGSDSGTTCNLTGAWALKVSVPVSWASTGLLNAGSGTAYLWALVQGTQTGTSVPGTVLPCGVDLPDFGGILPETYGVTFPNTLFDGSDLSPVNGTISVSSSSPGATYTSTTTANLIGISFANPATAAWPNLATAQADQVDADGDGHPGVTATPKTGTPPEGGDAYADPPTALLFFSRADALYMALRSVLSLNGTLTSCTTASGNATVTQMNSHILGCHISGGSATDYCNSTQSTFLDTNSPTLTVATTGTTPTFSAMKLTNAATCPDVRAAIP